MCLQSDARASDAPDMPLHSPRDHAWRRAQLRHGPTHKKRPHTPHRRACPSVERCVCSPPLQTSHRVHAALSTHSAAVAHAHTSSNLCHGKGPRARVHGTLRGRALLPAAVRARCPESVTGHAPATCAVCFAAWAPPALASDTPAILSPSPEREKERVAIPPPPPHQPSISWAVE